MERRLASSDRMASLGSLAAGVANEVNSPLTTVVSNLAVLKEQLQEALPEGKREELLGLLSELEEGADRIVTTVARMREFSRAESPTGSMSDAYDSSREALESYTRAFRAEPHQRGAVATIDGKVVGLECFDSAATFAKYLDKLVRSYAFDALETDNGKSLASSTKEVERFLARMQSAAEERFAALGEGEDIRLSGEGIAGGALSVGGRVIHLAGFEVSS